MKFLYVCVISFLILPACTNDRNAKEVEYQPEFHADTSEEKTLILGLPSFFFAETSQPLVKYLNANLKNYKVKVKACVNFESYLEDLKKGRFDFTIINALVALGDNGKEYAIVGKIMDDNSYTGLVFVRKDAAVVHVNDLKGKKISATKTNLAVANMMALYYLHQNGLDVNKDIELVDVSSMESAIMNTYLGKSEAGLTLTRNWNVYIKYHPEILSKLEAKWETPPLTNNALLFKNNKDTMLANDLLDVLLNVHQTVEGRMALQKLGIMGFEKAKEHTFKPLIDFKKKYDSVIF